MGLSNSVISALKILLPSDSIYFNVNVNTQMGFVLGNYSYENIFEHYLNYVSNISMPCTFLNDN